MGNEKQTEEEAKASRQVEAGIILAKKVILRLALFGVLVTASFMVGCPYYHVWQQHMEGAAQLAKATSNRQIAVQEAHAKMESAKSLASAEIERAKGVAEANKIIGDSLKGNEDYLRYLWISGLEHQGHDVIYVPTEAGLPILEAGKRPERSAPR